MTTLRPLVVLAALAPLAAAPHEVTAAGTTSEFAEGSIIFLASKRCERSPKMDADKKEVEWPGLVYARGKPPSWGKRLVGPCRGLDTWVLSESVAAGTLWTQMDHQAIEADPLKTLFDESKTAAAFKNAFGWSLPERGDDLPAGNVFLKFESKKVSALFDKLYVKPAAKIGLLTGQEVYDVLFKDFMTRFAREVALVKSSLGKPQLAKLLKAYQAAAKDGGARFNGPSHLKQVAAEALPKDNELSVRAGRTLGIMLRRTADGTWPTINKLLKKVVADYDPALSDEIGKSL